MSRIRRSRPFWRTSTLAFVVLAVLLASTGPLSSQIAYDGVLVGRANKWDSGPAHVFFGGQHTLWWASQGANYTDVIYRSTKNTSLGPGGWSTPAPVLSHQQVPWADLHVADPSVVRGSFSLSGTSYSYAMLFTANLIGGIGTDNRIGAAFSNDGITWAPYSNPVVSPASGATTDYGAGMSGIALDPLSGQFMHAFLDSTAAPIMRLNQTPDAVTFTPTPTISTQLAAAGRQGNDGQGPDIAFNPVDRHWYATIKCHDPQGIYDGETRVLRSTNPYDLQGGWDLVGTFNSTVTGLPQNHNPGLGKYGDGSLYIDAQGWAYVFFTVGNERPDVGTWQIAQGRFRPGATPSSVVVDVDATVPGFLTLISTAGGATVAASPASALVAVLGGPAANSDNLWNVQNNLYSKPGFNTLNAAGSEEAPRVAIEVRGIKVGTSYDVFGRYGTAVLLTPPDYSGAEMGLATSSMSRYDQFTNPHTVINNWANWQEWEVLIGIATAGADGIVRLYVDDNSLTTSATWTGLRLARR